MARKPTLSPTKVSTYLQCALKYRFIYIDGIGRYYRRARPYFSFGATLHGVLQQFHEAGATADLEAVQQSYSEKWISAGYESAQQELEYREVGETALRTYYASVEDRAQMGATTLFVEKTLSADRGNYRLTGRLDRIDEHADGTLEIIDYKSGRDAVTDEDVAKDLAMSIYQLLVRSNFPGRRVTATIIALRTGDMATAQMSDSDAKEFGEDLDRLADEILNREWFELSPKRVEACDHCDFLPRCAPELDKP